MFVLALLYRMPAQRKKPGCPRSKLGPPILHSPRKRRQKQWTNDSMLLKLYEMVSLYFVLYEHLEFLGRQL